MVRNTDLIKETMQLANAAVDLLGQIAGVHHCVQMCGPLCEKGVWCDNNAMKPVRGRRSVMEA